MFSVPFHEWTAGDELRASINADGAVTHHLSPDYHGDPLNKQGVLCFHNFGWEMLDNLRSAGFEDAYALMFWSTEMGYFLRQFQFIAEKRPH